MKVQPGARMVLAFAPVRLLDVEHVVAALEFLENVLVAGGE